MNIDIFKKATQNRNQAHRLENKIGLCKDTLRKMKKQDTFADFCHLIVESLWMTGYEDIEEEIYKAFMESATAIFEKYEKVAIEQLKEVNKEFEKI